MSAMTYLEVVRRRWRVALAFVVAGILGGIIFFFSATPLYVATARMYASSESASAADAYTAGLNAQLRVASYADLVTGPSVTQVAIERLKIDMTPSEVAAATKVQTLPNSVIYTISVTAADPAIASNLANALADANVDAVGKLETKPGDPATASRLTVVDRAAPPTTPTWPSITESLLAGLAGGVSLAAVAVALRERTDNTFTNLAELERVSSTTAIGSIPFDKETAKTHQIEFETEHSSTAESFRELRTQLNFLQVDNPPRVLAITSSVPGEGKSFTTVNLALALASGGHSVVIVDADLRRPMLAKRFGLVGSVGLSTVLSNQTDLADALQPTKFPGLHLLASGVQPPNPATLLGSERASALFQELREVYDWVIVDTPPLLSVIDAAEVAMKADGTIMAVQYGRTKKPEFTQALRKLTSINANVVGSILTKTPERHAGGYYYYYYYSESRPLQSSGTDRLLEARNGATLAHSDSIRVVDSTTVESSPIARASSAGGRHAKK